MVKTGTSHFSHFETSDCCLGSGDETHTKKLLVYFLGGQNLVDMGTFETKMSIVSQFLPSENNCLNSEL
jgi:hypothetical protein